MKIERGRKRNEVQREKGRCRGSTMREAGKNDRWQRGRREGKEMGK